MKKQVIRLNESQFNKIVRETVEAILNNETFDHHDPEYDEEETADEMAWRQDAYWDERMDNAINEAVKRTLNRKLKK
ncbi:MAG: hypothetical protein J6X18_17620 [Bacteroidales bacterium]|nr:hypothetical protein [Bacteroidales bacterium]